MKIKALFVDIGGVMIGTKPGAREKYAKLGINKEVSATIFRYLQISNRTEAEIAACLAENGVTKELWNNYIDEVFLSEARNEGLLEILTEAKQIGILIAYTTNNSSDLNSILDKYQIADLPDLVINSSEVGALKPDDKFWGIAVKRARRIIPSLEMAEILLLDDSEVNCLSARQFGMNAIIYKGEVSDKEIIKELDLKI